MPYKIITHNGKAHLDEVLGSALLALHIGEDPESIERMEAGDAAELVSSGNIPADTYFIDCGLIYDGRRKLYDHHQDRELDSSALLLFNEFFPHLENTDLHNYIKLVSKVDTKGAMSLDDFDMISESREYLSFSHRLLLKTFQEDPLLILRIFIAGLDDKIKFEKARAEARLWLDEEGHIEIIKIAELNILKYMVKPPSELAAALRSAVSDILDENNVTAIFSFDDKQDAVRTLYRTDSGHDLIDFSRCAPDKSIFNHPGGFFMKFIPANDDEWIELVKQAVV